MRLPFLKAKRVTMKCDCCRKIEKFDHIPEPREGWQFNMIANSVLCNPCAIQRDRILGAARREWA